MNAFSSQDSSSAIPLDKYMSIDDAAQYSGYNRQYLRRLMRTGTIEGVKVGQVWLARISSLEAYLKQVRRSGDRRYGPRVYHEYVEEQED